jgi:environmental stress-induced protein Ves
MRGEDAIHAELAGGPSRDFNAMTRRGAASARVVIWRTNGFVEHSVQAAVFVSVRGEFRIARGGESVNLPSGFALTLQEIGDGVQVSPATADGVLIGTLLNLS